MNPHCISRKSATLMFLMALTASTPHLAYSSETALPVGAQLSESGSIMLPPDAAESMWLDFYTSIQVAPVTTARLRVALAKTGYRFAANEAEAKATITISGYARIHNEAGSYDTGKMFLGEVLEENVAIVDQSATSAAERNALAYDAGVSQQAGRLLSSQGASGSFAGGIGTAIAADWLADASGLRGALNGAFRKAVGAKGNRPLICFGACKRTIHEVVIDLSVWQGKEFKTYTLTVSKTADDIEDELIPHLAESALSILLEKLSLAAKS